MVATRAHRLLAAALALALVALAGSGLALGLAGCRRTSVSKENTATRYVDASSVSDLRIAWHNGAVVVRVASDAKLDGKVPVSETAPKGWHDTPHMTIENEGGELAIGYGEGESLREKSLVVTLPKSCAGQLGTVTLVGMAGEFSLSDLVCRELHGSFEADSFSAKRVVSDTLELSASSGSLRFDGAVALSLDASVSSGNVRVRTSVAPERAAVSASSGNAELLLPRDAGFTAQVQVGAGSFDCDFKTDERDGTLVAGDGAMTLDASVSSGNLHIGKR